ncbi:hypothetical protein HDV01_000260 [Terramyces sp. JEL0728]|nr:hypothetical protein HDV01_000260 [Terramyces sp. JEL0728]
MDALRNQYLSSLQELTFNSKPIITNLTIIAEENLANAPVIVQAIEQQLSNAQPGFVIPLLYLMDSILKNVGKGYVAAFQKNLVRVFSDAYTKVNDADKARFQRTLQTWKATPGGYLFPSHVIAGIERAINVANLPPVGYIMNNGQRPPAPLHSQAAKPPLTQAQVLQRLTNLLGQKNALMIGNPNNYQRGNEINILTQLLEVVQSTALDPNTLGQINSKIDNMALAVQKTPPVSATLVTSSMISGRNGNHLPISNTLGIGLNKNGIAGLGSTGLVAQLGSTAGLNGLAGETAGLLGQSISANTSGLGMLSSTLNTSLLSNLNSSSLTGLLSTLNSSALLSMTKSDQTVPVIQMTQSEITKPIKKLYNILYDDIRLQCKQCALRFPGENGKEELTAHLDWHFRKNRRKHEKKKTSSREWYLTDPEWVIEQPIEPTENQAAPVFFDQSKEPEVEVQACIPTSDPINKCEICKETIEKFYDDDHDGWMLRGAVKFNELSLSSGHFQPDIMSRKDIARQFSFANKLIEVSDSEAVLDWPEPIIPPKHVLPDSNERDYLPLILNARVYDVADETPLTHARKREDTQPIFSFKCRGAFNKMFNLTKEQKIKGVCCVSAGNHAQGVALAAQKLGISAKIVMPTFAPEIKVENVKRLGANVILFGNNFDEAKKECMRICKAEDLTFVPPFDDPYVIAGQGTVGMEILNQIRQTRLDAIFVCCGGGGLISGIAAYVKRVRPEVKIIGVNTIDSDSMYQSLLKGSAVEIKQAGLFSDGTSVRLVGSECARICKRSVDDMILVSNDEICAAIKDAFDDCRAVLEPAGALGIAGLKKYLIQYPELRGGVFVAVASGANMNFDRLRFVTERASMGQGKEALLSVVIPERSGALRDLHNVVTPRSVTELSYRYSTSKFAHIFLGFDTKTPDEAFPVIDQINCMEGYEAINISENDMANQHIRYLSGGRSNIENEVLCRFKLPERPDRNHGSDFGRVLVGFQFRTYDVKKKLEFFTKMKEAGYTDVVDEGMNPVYKHFLL